MNLIELLVQHFRMQNFKLQLVGWLVYLFFRVCKLKSFNITKLNFFSIMKRKLYDGHFNNRLFASVQFRQT